MIELIKTSVISRFIFFITVCFVFVANICPAAEYYCGNAKSSYNYVNLYNPDKTAKQYCEWIKNDKIISDQPLSITYEQCVKNFNTAKDKYNKGMCTPVIIKNHIYKDKISKKDYKCKVYLVQGTTRVIRTACDIPDTEISKKSKDSNKTIVDISEAAMDYFEKLYRKGQNR